LSRTSTSTNSCHWLLHHQIHRHRRRAAEFGRTAAQDLDAFQFTGRHAPDLRQCEARIGRRPFAIDGKLHRIAAHATRAGAHAAVTTMLAGLDARQLADHLADRQAAERLDFLTVDHGFL
jgi:hypothetical protein